MIDGELLTLANFLERRGLHAEALAAFEPSLKAMAEDDMNTFVDFLGRLFYNAESKAGAPQLARKIGLDWAGDDEMRWDELLVAAFGDSDGTESWWEWTAEWSINGSSMAVRRGSTLNCVRMVICWPT